MAQKKGSKKSKAMGRKGMKKTKGGAGYLKLGSIKGESTSAGHEGWINIQSLSPPVSRPGQ